MDFIKFKKNNLCVENISAFALTKKYKTPFYCYSLSQLKNNYYDFSRAFKKIQPLICFSVKSNPIMWRDIFIQNKDNNAKMIDKFIKNLKDLKKAIQNENGKKLEKIFSKTKKLEKISLELAKMQKKLTLEENDS